MFNADKPAGFTQDDICVGSYFDSLTHSFIVEMISFFNKRVQAVKSLLTVDWIREVDLCIFAF